MSTLHTDAYAAQKHSDTRFNLAGHISHANSAFPWISDTRSQGYTGLQSLVKCLDRRDNVSETCKQRF